MSTTLAVLTCARKRDYLSRTLASLGDVGACDRRLVWCDGPVTIPDAAHGWEVGGSPMRQGPPNTFAFWDLLAAVTGDLLFIEDDVLASPGAVAYAVRMGCQDGLAYVSWFDPVCRRTFRLPRVRYFDAGEIIPCQARTIPARTISRLLEFRSHPDWAPGTGSDACVATTLTGQMAAVHVPSLFQHVGNISEVDADGALTGDRLSESWLGESYDVARGFKHIQPSDLWGDTQ